MRRPAIGIFICACALAITSCVLPLSSRAYAQSTAPAFDKGLLWRVEKAGAAPSYLFGTVHLADKRVTTLPEPVRTRFDAARSFTMEVSPDQANITALAARMLFIDGRDLPGLIGEALFRKLGPLTANLGLPPEMVRLFKPWAMVMLLQMPPQQPEEVLDFVLQRMALQQGKSLGYLESVDEQVAAFEGMAEKDQVTLLRHAVETHDELKAQTEQLLQAYLQRDLARMWQIGEAEVAQRPELELVKAAFDRRLLFDRNTRMVSRMQPQLKTGAAFIAIGALHLYGDKGVLNLLAREGWLLTRVY